MLTIWPDFFKNYVFFCENPYAISGQDAGTREPGEQWGQLPPPQLGSFGSVATPPHPQLWTLVVLFLHVNLGPSKK